MSEETTENSRKSALVKGLERLLERKDRAALADLRRGLGREAGTAMEIYPIVSRYLSKKQSRKHDDAVFLVAPLFALYPRKSWETADRKPKNFGKSVSLIKDESGSIERRFVALLNANSEDLPYHLRQMVSLLKAKEAPINWSQLFYDVRDWHGERRDRVRRDWARGFWSSYDSENNSTTQTISTEGEQQ